MRRHLPAEMRARSIPGNARTINYRTCGMSLVPGMKPRHEPRYLFIRHRLDAVRISAQINSVHAS